MPHLFTLPRGPKAVAFAVSLMVVFVLTVIAASIGGGYILMIHYVTAFQAQQHAAQVKGSVGLCKAVLQMDLASKGAKFPHTDLSYSRRLATALHQLYVSTQCAMVLRK